MKIKISKEISLPLDVVTQTIAILAKRRAGKSYTMRKLVEQLLTNDQQVILVDPKGDQWGIRSLADGKNPGYPIVILGGEHGDAPLEVNAGEVVAKLAVEERVSILLDLSIFRKHEIATFMTAFLENLYRLKAQEAYRTPVMLVIDEADAIAPQKPQKGEERMLGAAEDIVRRGGQRGIGCALITQRSAVLNKNVLTQAQMLIVLRTIAPQDLAAMKAWIDVHGTIEEGKQLMDSLPSLPIGDAWFWSPGWPTDAGIFQRSHILPIETFDSGATPKPGQKKIVPKNLADVDLDALKKQMSATIEKAKSENPKLLKQEIEKLKREIVTMEQKKQTTSIDPKAIDHAVSLAIEFNNQTWEKRMNTEKDKHLKILRSIDEIVTKFTRGGDPQPFKYHGGIETYNKVIPGEASFSPSALEKAKNSVGLDKYIHAKETSIPMAMGILTGPEQRIMDAIAWMESIGVMEPEQTAVAFLAGYTIGGGGFNNPKGSLRTKGMIEYLPDNKIKLTDNGRSLSSSPEATLTSKDLHEKVLNRLGGPERKLLNVLLSVYPDDIPKEKLADASGYAFGSGGFNNPLGRLRTLGLIEYLPGSRVKARDILFIT